ncbi:cell wall hydrolase, SleB [Alkaliphilus metalliredigens QYMF]|uniref:Cell wall hydrolase, SleB n=1 Tax=Alkaliphilus metalliredigens (strain QYMF) TaxID=293826 RepID=A6TT19_ALKMQ|nr:cell wall hydrolase [Alkaliphilus metalliredigens]ABR49337.1 cell wall hydrolase, SleB [Alkaliphilus metalliredigens QYMF]
MDIKDKLKNISKLRKQSMLIIFAVLTLAILTTSILAQNLQSEELQKISLDSESIGEEAAIAKEKELDLDLDLDLELEEGASTEQGEKVSLLEENTMSSSATYATVETTTEEALSAPSTSTQQTKEQSEQQSQATKVEPITADTYQIQNGDSLFLISQRAGVSVDHLKNLNRLNSDQINVGQTLQIKGQAPASSIPSNTTVSRGADREDDMYWLSRIIHAEAQGESYQGKVAVGNVIMNRVGDGNFPNSIYGVVFDRQHGYTQFSPVLDGSIHNKPHQDSVRAAREVLDGARPVGDALYFLNPRKATNFWIVQNRKHMMTIGLHDFYH